MALQRFGGLQQLFRRRDQGRIVRADLSRFAGGNIALDQLSLGEGNPAAGKQIKFRPAVGGKGMVAEFAVQTFGKRVGAVGIAVVDKHHLRLFLKAPQPVDQAVFVCVAADAGQGLDLGRDLNFLIEQLDAPTKRTMHSGRQRLCLR